MNYTTANDQLTGRCAGSRKIANNTYLERRGENIAVRLHSTDVVTFTPNGDVTLNTGGWKTVTTKARMNEFQRACTVWADRGVWYVRIGRVWNSELPRIPYADGITIHADGTVTGAGEDPQGMAKLKRRIAAYAKGYLDAFVSGKVPAPGVGDCFYCAMSVAEGKDKGKGLGEATHDTAHLEYHLQEKYYVPSLLARAWQRFPQSQCAQMLMARMWTDEEQLPAGITKAFGGSFDEIGREQLQKCLRRYLTEQFGMQA